MFTKDEIENFIVFDLETVSGEKDLKTLEKKNKHMADVWRKRCDYLRRKHSDNASLSDEEIYEQKTGLQAEFGRISCISVAFVRYDKTSNIPTIKTVSYIGEEKDIIGKFFTFVLKVEKDLPGAIFAGHNIMNFDIPFLCKRAIINGFKIPKSLSTYGKKPWELTFVDTIKIWGFGSYSDSFTSLDILTTALGIPTPKSDIDGSEVNKVFWIDNDSHRIAIYCEKDVAATLNVLIHLGGFEPVEESNIISVTKFAKTE